MLFNYPPPPAFSTQTTTTTLLPLTRISHSHKTSPPPSPNSSAAASLRGRPPCDGLNVVLNRTDWGEWLLLRLLGTERYFSHIKKVRFSYFSPPLRLSGNKNKWKCSALLDRGGKELLVLLCHSSRRRGREEASRRAW